MVRRAQQQHSVAVCPVTPYSVCQQSGESGRVGHGHGAVDRSGRAFRPAASARDTDTAEPGETACRAVERGGGERGVRPTSRDRRPRASDSLSPCCRVLWGAGAGLPTGMRQSPCPRRPSPPTGYPDRAAAVGRGDARRSKPNCCPMRQTSGMGLLSSRSGDRTFR